MNRKIIIGGAVGILVVGIVLGFMLRKPQTRIVMEEPKKEEVQRIEEKSEGYSGQLEYAEGAVEKRLSEDEGWRPAEKGDVFVSGAEVRTLAAAKAVITFEDGSLVRLDENTQIKINTSKDAIALEMPSGTVFNKVTKDASRQYTVATGEYNMRALGTIFSVSNAEGASPELMVLESQVEVEKNNAGKVDMAQTGEKIAMKKDKMEKNKISKGDIDKKFIAWNIKEDKLEVKLEAEEKEVVATTSAQIILSGKKSDDGVKLVWEAKNLGKFDGFKLVKSKEANPVYPGDDYKYITAKETRSYLWNISDGNKYHFRACLYVGGKCSLYSNDILVEVPEKSGDSGDDDYASSVSLSAVEDGDNTYLKWSISGGEAPVGYKVVKSKDKNPEYPEDGYYKYISDGDTKKVKLEGFDSGDTYHFRVCIYKGGSCGAYSNDVKVSF